MTCIVELINQPELIQFIVISLFKKIITQHVLISIFKKYHSISIIF